jgi:molecular chaperone GrpE
VVAGMRNLHQQLVAVLRTEGLEPIEAAGAAFDPELHEAVSGGGDGHLVVTTEARRGYTLNGRVLRPTLVEVAAEDMSEGEA